MSAAARAPGVFASRTFRRYFVGQSLSYVGDGLRLLSVPLLAYHLTHSALSTGTALICEVAPFSVFSLVGGSLADRLDRRKLMLGCDAVRFAVTAFFAVSYALHVLTLPMIYAGLVVMSICAAGFLGGQSSSIPYLLGREKTTKAMALLIAAENGSNLITPAIGGAIFAYFGPLPALTINAVTYLASQISLALIPSLGPDRTTGLPSLRHLVRRHQARLSPAVGRSGDAGASARGLYLQRLRLRLLCDTDSLSQERLRRDRSAGRHLFWPLGAWRRRWRVACGALCGALAVRASAYDRVST